jgi:hypothetical protein
MNRREFLKAGAVVAMPGVAPEQEDLRRLDGTYIVTGTINKAYVFTERDDQIRLHHCPIDIRYAEPANAPLFLSVEGVSLYSEPGTGDSLLTVSVYGYLDDFHQRIRFAVHPSELNGLQRAPKWWSLQARGGLLTRTQTICL